MERQRKRGGAGRREGREKGRGRGENDEGQRGKETAVWLKEGRR